MKALGQDQTLKCFFKLIKQAQNYMQFWSTAIKTLPDLNLNLSFKLKLKLNS